MGAWDGPGWGTGIALPTTHPATPRPALPRVHPSPRLPVPGTSVAPAVVSEAGVGLKSVAQLTLRSLISGLRGITEGYNLLRIDNR